MRTAANLVVYLALKYQDDPEKALVANTTVGATTPAAVRCSAP
jgi:hypothetical protein